MNKLLLLTILSSVFLLTPSVLFAQGMMGNWTNPSSSGSSPGQTAIQTQQKEEQEGQKLLQDLKKNTTTCQKLTNDNFEKIGEYVMGQAIGDTARHIQMNTMMQAMMGQAGEEQMHIVLGKRASGCDPNAQPPSDASTVMPMMWMMGGGAFPMTGYSGWNNMMGLGVGFFGWIFMILFLVLLILGIIALIRYLGRSGQQSRRKDSQDILKERYAKGEITKKEFEQMKKDLA